VNKKQRGWGAWRQGDFVNGMSGTLYTEGVSGAVVRSVTPLLHCGLVKQLQPSRECLKGCAWGTWGLVSSCYGVGAWHAGLTAGQTGTEQVVAGSFEVCRWWPQLLLCRYHIKQRGTSFSVRQHCTML
jgi:hypothetical protein